MEGKIRKAKEHIAETLEIPSDVILDLPRIIITSNKEITIENHKGIIKFEEGIIKLNSKMGIIAIEGKDFEIVFMGGNTLTLKGRFKSVVYEGYDKV
ncbi:sporulation protein YqfC [Clostridium hydrogeniformans]|uniref:sporulation protein YqfC n=1 Tax=Clostridium hydrogeniformans TaxID=349933 RepID=UPI0004855BE0|nr:sporulation protein YqfC [Clostridium hydrogeniformans]